MSKRKQVVTSRTAVVSAALKVVDAVGLEGLTIRAVASAAGIATMNVYSRVASKEELLNLMYAEIAFRVYADAEYRTWPEALEALCHRVRNELLEHPRWIPLLTRPGIPVQVPLRERILTLMANAGIAAAAGVSSVTRAALFALGLTMVELSFRKPDGSSALADRLDDLRNWATDETVAAEAAATHSAFKATRPLDWDDTFSGSVTAFVSGLEHVLRHTPERFASTALSAETPSPPA